MIFTGYRLIAVASGSRFCNANNNGNANYNDASNRNSNGGIRPLLWNCRNNGMRKYSAGNEPVSFPYGQTGAVTDPAKAVGSKGAALIYEMVFTRKGFKAKDERFYKCG